MSAMRPFGLASMALLLCVMLALSPCLLLSLLAPCFSRLHLPALPECLRGVPPSRPPLSHTPPHTRTQHVPPPPTTSVAVAYTFMVEGKTQKRRDARVGVRTSPLPQCLEASPLPPHTTIHITLQACSPLSGKCNLCMGHCLSSYTLPTPFPSPSLPSPF